MYINRWQFCLDVAGTARGAMCMIVCSSVFLYAFPAHATGDDFYADLRQRVIKYTASNPSARIDLALIHGSEIIVADQYGDGSAYKDLKDKTIYRAGSIAKILTALAIMQLEDQAEIDIDQPVFAYLPRFLVKRRFSNVNPVTIRHLLTHHSGLPTNIVKGQWSDAHFTTIVEQIRNEYLSYPPEFVYAYSNIGYSLLGAVIEEVTGQSYESYIEENIFNPLGMVNSGFDAASIHSPGFVQPDSEDGNRLLLPIRDIPAMGLYTTAEDMAHLLIMLANGGTYKGKTIIHPAVLEEMMERNNDHVMLDYDRQSGIGFLLNHCIFEQPGDVVEHGGQTMHYTSHFVLLPEYGVGAIVLANSPGAKKFVHQLARDLVARGLQENYPDDNSQPPVLANDGAEDKDRSIEGKKRGKYLTKSGLLTLQVDESDMCACIQGKRYDLVPEPEGWYGIKDKQKNARVADIEFSPQEVAGKDVLAIRKDGHKERLGEYIPDEGIPSRWRNRLGDYQVENPDPEFPFKDVCLMEEDNIMYLSYRMPLLSDKRIDIPLTALDDEQAITTGLGRGRGESVQAEQTADGEYLLYSGYLVKKISP